MKISKTASGKYSRMIMMMTAILPVSFFITCERIEPERVIIIRSGMVSGITRTSCTVTGTLYDVGESGVTQHGFCWSESPDPGTSDQCIRLGAKDNRGEFSAELTGLTPGTAYYVRPFASEGDEPLFGSSLSFTTNPLDLPAVNTGAIDKITSHSAECTGNVVSDGGSPVTDRGVCWNTSPAPTADMAHTTESGGTGEYTSLLEELAPQTTYYVRAYATNSVGTAYGNDQSFTTLPEATEPVVVTDLPVEITTTTAILGGSITDDGGADIESKGLCWSLEPEPTLEDANDFFIDLGGGSGDFFNQVTELIPDAAYFVRAYAINSEGKTGYGNQREFRTQFDCGTRKVDLRDGKTYLTVKVAEQCWMAENLNAGEPILVTETPSDDGAIQKYCYDDNVDNCDLHGGLYTWDEMMQYTTMESTRGVCPDGWHIPSDHEWKELEMALGMTETDANGTGWRGTDQGGQLKAAGTAYWDAPNEGATNSSLFTALPSGNITASKTYDGLGYMTDFWTSTLIIDDYIWYRYLDTDHSQVYRVDGHREYGTPVRCVKD